MSFQPSFVGPQPVYSVVANSCPHWCVTHHGVHLGEEDWIHTSEPVMIADGTVARLCMSIDPDTGAKDGPYVLIGNSELTLTETAELGSSLLALAGGHE